MEPTDTLSALVTELTSGDDERAMEAVQKISAHGSEALPALQELLSTSDTDSRWWATWALAEIPDPQVPGLLREALHDPEVTVRQAAALALRQQPDPQAIPDLIKTLREKDPTLVNLCAAALVAIGKEAVPELIQVLEESDIQTARLAAARSLAMIGDERSMPALLGALGKNSALIEHWANAGLERMENGVILFKPKGLT
jgi:HEAT repeat protein